MSLHVLVSIPQAEWRRRVASALARASDVEVHEVAEADALRTELEGRVPDLVVATPAGLSGPPRELVETLRRHRSELVVPIGAATAAERSRLQSEGVLTLLEMEVDGPALDGAVRAVLDQRRSAIAERLAADQSLPDFGFSDFSAQSPAMAEVIRLAKRVARSDSSVLLLGETGTGKEWVARAIHSAGARAARPLVAVNCAAIPESMLESELFGHERGAFTGAHRSRRGCFELADGGSLLLDEIGEMPPNLQSKLLRVLQEKEVRRLGSEEATPVDVRILAATSQDPESAIAAQTLRPDLYYRLAVVTIRVPPLRDRPEDVLPLFESHVDRFRAHLARWEIEGIAPEVEEALLAYRWPGNVRELINVAERAVLLAEGSQIGLDDLPSQISRNRGAPDSGAEPAFEKLFDLPLRAAERELLASFERDYLTGLLSATRGQVGEAARRAGIDPRTLYNKMKRHGLDKRDFRASARNGEATNRNRLSG